MFQLLSVGRFSLKQRGLMIGLFVLLGFVFTTTLAQAANGQCGFACQNTFASTPTDPDLCNSGVASWTNPADSDRDSVGDDGRFNWSCMGTSGGSDEKTCWANSSAAGWYTNMWNRNLTKTSGLVEEGETINLSAQIKNNGTKYQGKDWYDEFQYRFGDSGAYTTFATKPHLIPPDTTLGVSGTKTDVTSFSIPTGHGGENLWIQHCVDTTYNVNESDESVADNCKEINLGAVIGTPGPNSAPNADAGSNRSITLPTNTSDADGSSSSDADGSIVSYAWIEISRPATAAPSTITNGDTATPSFSNLDTAGTYVYELTVTDDDGATDSDTMQVSIAAAVDLVSDSITCTAGCTGTNVLEGTTQITVVGAVRNTSATDANTTFTNQVNLSGDLSGTITSANIPSLAGGTSVSRTFNIDTSSLVNGDLFTVEHCVDAPGDAVVEGSGEGNNCDTLGFNVTSVSVTPPDMSIGSGSDSDFVRSGESTDINWTISSTGDLECEVKGPNLSTGLFNVTGGIDYSDAEEVLNLRGASKYVLTCVDLPGRTNTYTDFVIVKVVPNHREF